MWTHTDIKYIKIECSNIYLSNVKHDKSEYLHDQNVPTIKKHNFNDHKITLHVGMLDSSIIIRFKF